MIKSNSISYYEVRFSIIGDNKSPQYPLSHGKKLNFTNIPSRPIHILKKWFGMICDAVLLRSETLTLLPYIYNNKMHTLDKQCARDQTVRSASLTCFWIEGK